MVRWLKEKVSIRVFVFTLRKSPLCIDSCDYDTNSSSKFFEHLDLINLRNAISYRDEFLAAHLNNLGITHLVDIGCDFGSLLSSCKSYGIKELGYDLSPEAVAACKISNLNAGIASFENIVEKPEAYLSAFFALSTDSSTVRAISILNTIGGKWEDESLRNKVLYTSGTNLIT
jgi:hypothetical protein